MILHDAIDASPEHDKPGTHRPGFPRILICTAPVLRSGGTSVGAPRKSVPVLSGCREPIYPSAEVSFEVGASPDALHQCGGRFKVPYELSSEHTCALRPNPDHVWPHI